MSSKNILILTIMSFFYIAPVNAIKRLDGSAEYRLLFIRDLNRDFDPFQDITKNTKTEKERKRISEIFTTSALKSILPVINSLRGEDGQNIMISLMTSASSVRSQLIKEISDIEVDYPINYLTYLTPWESDARELFYSSEKISATTSRAMNVLKVNPGSKSFYSKLTNEISLLHAKLSEKKNIPAYLLSLKLHLQIDKSIKNIIISALVGISPKKITLKEPIVNEQVKISKIVIPDKKTVALIKIIIPIDKNDKFNKTSPPRMILKFGNFSKVQESKLRGVGIFTIDDDTKHTSSPRLEGSPKFDDLEGGKKLIFKTLKGITYPLRALAPVKDIAINFNINTLNINLLTQRVQELDLLLSPGLVIGSENKVVGKLKMASVESQFKDEINAEIENSINTNIKNGKLKIEEIIYKFFETKAK